MKRLLLILSLAVFAAPTLHANVHLPAIFGSHMVLQQGQKNPVWGWAQPGEGITVSIDGQSHATKAGPDGRWQVMLDPLTAGGPHRLVVKGNNEVVLEDVLVGEVWVCSGQSNMQWAVGQSDDADLERLAAKHPRLRLITVPQIGTQNPQREFAGAWQVCTPETVGDFSAVGYFFGRQLLDTLDVPIGLIDNSWGGSSAEAWVPRKALEADARYGALMERWKSNEANQELAGPMAEFEAKLAEWDKAVAAAKVAGRMPPRPPGLPRNNNLATQHRPGNLYNGCLNPVIGFGIKGVIWYQGESNAGRAYQYRHLFPLMIQEWRKAWNQGDFSFYWVQLADFQDESNQPGDSAWAELREAQTMTMSALPNTGEAVIIDVGEGRDIHPRNKQAVGKRLARWALAKDYNVDVPCQSPTYKSMEVRDDGKVLIHFDHVGRGLYSFDVKEPVGFAIAGEDKQFVWARANIVDEDTVEVWSSDISKPLSVRYAWAQNPVCTLQSRDGLPATPFRTDDWPGVTAGKD